MCQIHTECMQVTSLSSPLPFFSKSSDRKFKAFVLDKDGTLVNGGHGIPGARDFLLGLMEQNIPFVILSNTGEKTSSSVASSLSSILDISLTQDHIVTALDVLCDHVREQGYSNVVAVGKGTQVASLPCLPSSSPDCVAVMTDGDVDDYYATLCAVTRVAQTGVPVLATSSDTSVAVYMEDGKTTSFRPGPGAFLEAVRCVVPEARVRVFGKGHDSDMGKKAVDKLRGQGYLGDEKDVLMVGDRFDTDVREGRRQRWGTCLVESGCHTASHRTLFPSDMADMVAGSVRDLCHPLSLDENGQSAKHMVADVVRSLLRYVPIRAAKEVACRITSIVTTYMDRLEASQLSSPRRVRSYDDVASLSRSGS